jgi:tetratricopeptide (TPR) repeat protein
MSSITEGYSYDIFISYRQKDNKYDGWVTEFVDKALELKPDYYWYLDAKGWGLYKQGKFDEALKYLEKCIDLSPSSQHNVHLHLEAAKKAVASQKRTDR